MKTRRCRRWKKRKRRRKGGAGAADIRFISRTGKEKMFDFLIFPEYYSVIGFSQDQHSDQVNDGTNLDSSLSWRKYL